MHLITILRSMVQNSQCILSSYDAVMFRAVLTLEFFGFLRPGEYLSNTRPHALRADDIDVQNGYVQPILRSFKFSRGPVTVRVDSLSDTSICPVASVRAYMKIRPQSRSRTLLFFLTSAALPLKVSKAASMFGMVQPPGSELALHSLRVGGASWAVAEGWQDARIRAHGRWRLSVFIDYARTV